MDFGAALKKASPNPGRRSAHYSRQSAFEGSFRQLRGRVIRSLVKEGPESGEGLINRLGREANPEDLYRALEALKKESLVAEEAGIYRIK